MRSEYFTRSEEPCAARRPEGSKDKGWPRVLAVDPSFETRPSAAPQDEVILFTRSSELGGGSHLVGGGRGLKLSHGGSRRNRTALLLLVPLSLRFFLLFGASHLTFRHGELP